MKDFPHASCAIAPTIPVCSLFPVFSPLILISQLKKKPQSVVNVHSPISLDLDVFLIVLAKDLAILVFLKKSFVNARTTSITPN